MKKLLLALICSTGLITAQAQQTFQITGSYSPAVLNITAGDTVQFNNSSAHPAVEVSQATWNANGNTSNGGFNMVSGGTKIKFNTPGTIYYVCNVHFASGMKGQIVVAPSTASVNENSAKVNLNAYPNPVRNLLSLEINTKDKEELKVEIYNLIGEKLMELPSSIYVAGKNLVTIDFTEYSNGVYFVKVIGREENYSLKIMK